MTQVTEPPPSGAGQEDYNPFAEEGKASKKKDEPQVHVYTTELRNGRRGRERMVWSPCQLVEVRG